MKLNKRYYQSSLLVLGALSSSIALAAPFTSIRIGDQDGFGFTNTVGLVAANGGAADTNGNGLLQQTEYLPSLNGNGTVATGSGDDFDNRTSLEIANTAISGSGFTDSGTIGSKWTDISLSTSYGNPNHDNGDPDGILGAFPDSGGTGTPNEPIFNFRFDVAKTDIVFGSTIFFNLIFGDYDVTPADVEITTNNGSNGPNGTSTIALQTQQSQGAGNDGLIQAATAVLQFSDVFSDGGSVWNGYLDVTFDANNEPYTAFDFVELSLDQIPSTVPEPGMLMLLGTSLLSLLGIRRKRYQV